MGRGRKSKGGWAGPLGQIWLQKKEEQDRRREIQHAGSAEERERIEAKQQGREAFADSGRWGDVDQHGRTIPEPAPAPPPVQRLQIQDPATIKQTHYQSTKPKKKAKPKTTTSPTSAVAGSLGSTSGGTVNL